MPELSRFFGIIIRMYMEAGGPLAGQLPRRQRRLVEAWAELHEQTRILHLIVPTLLTLFIVMQLLFV